MKPTRSAPSGSTPAPYQGGYLLLIVPIILVGIAFFTVQAIKRSRMSMQVAGSELSYEQTKMCAQQCASIAVNATARAMNANIRIVQGTEKCPCREDDGADKISCSTFRGDPAYSVYQNCYGLQVVKAEMDLRVECKQGNDRAAKLVENVNFDEVPIFQFAVFFDKTLDIHPGPPMELRGRVHSNDTVKLYPRDGLQLYDWVTSARSVMAANHGISGERAPIGFPRKDGSGPDKSILFGNPGFQPLDRLIPDWSAYQKAHLIAYNGQARGCGSIDHLSIPTDGVEDPYELIEWRNPGDSYLLKRRKFAWKANLIYKDGKWLDNKLASVAIDNPIRKPARTVLEDARDARRITFWDGREQLMVKVLPVDVARLQQRPGDSIIYIHDGFMDGDQENNDPSGVLLYNGAKLLRPITIVTNTRLYMWGDFNSVPGYSNGTVKNNAFPAAIICDVFSQLSNQWQPGDYSYRKQFSKRVLEYDSGEKTVLNACLMLGRALTGYHNALHFMEDWTDVPFIFTGSVVSLWDPHISTEKQNASYFPPLRLWSFDPMYKDITNMPPGTPRLVNPKLNTWEMRRE